MKKKFICILLLLVLTASVFCLAACGNKDNSNKLDENIPSKNDSEQTSSVTRYDLTSMKLGSYDLSNSFYYNYVRLDEKNGTYYLENKDKNTGIVSKQSGSYSKIGNEIKILTNNENPSIKYWLGAGETVRLVGNTLTISVKLYYYGQSNATYVAK